MQLLHQSTSFRFAFLNLSFATIRRAHSCQSFKRRKFQRQLRCPDIPLRFSFLSSIIQVKCWKRSTVVSVLSNINFEIIPFLSLSLSPSLSLLRIYRLINNKTEEGTQPAELHRKEAFKNFKQPFHGYIACSIHPCYSCFRSIRFFFDR